MIRIRFTKLSALCAAALMAATALGALAAAKGPVPAPTDVKGIQVLFSGKPAEVAANWTKHGSTDNGAWKVVGGAMVSGGGDIVSKQKFTDFQLHVEFKVPFMPDKTGQGRGNSGVFLQGRYEIQVLDSYSVPDPGTGDCGSVYGKAAPLVKAYRAPKQWQTYDIIFRAPRFDGEKKIEDARVSVLLNGVAVQNNTIIPDPTWGGEFRASQHARPHRPSGPWQPG